MRALRLPALAVCSVLCLQAAALAQSYTAPGGELPATAPGGTEGVAGYRNAIEAIESGEGVPLGPRPGVVIEQPIPEDAPAYPARRY